MYLRIGIVTLASLVGCQTRQFNNEQGELLTLQPLKPATVMQTSDVSVETEMQMNPNVMAFLTTKDGTVGALLKQGETLPAWFVSLANVKFPGISPQRVTWDSLSYDEKVKLLRDVLPQHKQLFVNNRRYFGLSVRKSVKGTFAADTELFGKKYARGTQDIDVSGFLLDRVEAASHTSMDKFTDLELHFRGRQSGGKMGADVWKLQEVMGIPQAGLHVNMVNAIPFAEFQNTSKDMPCRTAEAYRRVNLLAEFKGIIEDSGLVRDSVHGGLIYFGSLKANELALLPINYLSKIATTKRFDVGQNHKKAWVGFRGTDLYGDGLWGFEFRAVARHSDVPSTRYLLDAVHARFVRNDLGISDAEWQAYRKFYEESAPFPSCSLVTMNWYNDGVNVSSVSSDDAEWQAAHIKAEAKLEEAAKLNEAVRLFTHDWSKDSLLYKDTAMKSQIRKTQIAALGKLMTIDEKNAGQTNQLVKSFLRESGLYQAVLRSYDLSAK